MTDIISSETETISYTPQTGWLATNPYVECMSSVFVPASDLVGHISGIGEGLAKLGDNTILVVGKLGD